eukprot:GSMAST32.ASY1.ANO1.2525.1 assembled CDS
MVFFIFFQFLNLFFIRNFVPNGLFFEIFFQNRSSYNPINEFHRMVPQNHSQWRLFHNINFKTSPTYPEYLIIPNTQLFSDEDLSAVCAWRSKARFPAVTWHCRKSGVILARSAMPLRGRAGMSNCRADENLCDIYRKSVINSYGSKPSNRRRIFGTFVVIDCRPAINAKATQIIKGGGEEKASRYQNTTLERLYIENIHEMRNSLVELAKICLPDVQNTGWLRHIRMVLAGSARVAQLLIAENTSVLVHCSDGWDRTAQICATAQLLVDPYYRTLEGFGVLVEKDWLSFGHKFHDRIGHGQRPRKVSNSFSSPIFTQWIDCVWQLTRQFPTAFEFSERMLIFVADMSSSCRFGNFLCNSERERSELNVKQKTPCIWSYICSRNHHRNNKSNRELFSNPCTTCYRKVDRPLYPSTSPKRLVLWDKLYLRFDPALSIPGSDDETWEGKSRVLSPRAR